MSEIQDLKNHILALQHKINDVVKLMQSSSQNNDRINEILNLIHNIGFERLQSNGVLFEQIMPDFIQRITNLERFSKSKGDHEYRCGDHFVLNFGKGNSKKERYLMYVTDKGLDGFCSNERVEFWEKR